MAALSEDRAEVPPETPVERPVARAQPCPETYIALGHRLAETARTVIRPLFRSRLAVDEKADLSPVTVADREAEAALRKLIAAEFPDHGVVGEEYGSDRPDAEFVWVLDPVDGTKRFITANPLFGTLIALLCAGRPILGIIDMPMLSERWVGAAGQATRRHTAEGVTEAQVRACPALAEATLMASSPHMFGDDFDRFERVRKASKLPLYGGDCYNYGLLADGFADLIVEATMGPYDYLPLVPVVTGAGGTMSDWQGKPLGLESGGSVLAAGDRRVHEEAQSLLQAR